MKGKRFYQNGGAYETFFYLIGLFVAIFIGIVIYYKTIGYTISFGWDKLFFILEKKQFVDVNLTVDKKEEAAVTLVPQPEPVLPEVPAIPAILPLSPEERPNGLPGATEASTSIFEPSKPHEEVFNISRNIYKYDDAEPLCKAMGAELATYDQILEAYKKGADWCNYGWVKGQMAVFPTQEKTWEKLQKDRNTNKYACGKPGLNGGYFDNPDLAFGVNCFGPKPLQNETDDLQNSAEFTTPPTAEQIEFDKKVQKFREQLGNVSVLPFNREHWSS